MLATAGPDGPEASRYGGTASLDGPWRRSRTRSPTSEPFPGRVRSRARQDEAPGHRPRVPWAPGNRLQPPDADCPAPTSKGLAEAKCRGLRHEVAHRDPIAV